MPSNTLTDMFGRRIEYLRISVIDRCDLRCSYCLPKRFKGFEEPANWLSFEEIERVTRAFAFMSVHRIRLTGGEPLMRRDLTELVDRLAHLPGISDLALSSNCTRMDKLAAPLYRAGVSRLNVSLDSLRPKVFEKITGGSLNKVLTGIEACQSAGFEPIRVNTVVMRGVNDDEIDAILDYCIERGFTLRLIETMPMGDTGRNAVNKYIDLQTVRQRLERRIELIPDILPGGGPARYYRLAGTDTRIGFITPISQHFCETCNRVRLTVDGDLYLCLGHEHAYPLRQLLRDGIDDTGLTDHLRRAIALKPERHEFSERPEKLIRFMAKSGG
ncbi:MAG: GTP 3',8-cyclase MoaA [Candidatus Thiodiazotropha lotti]|nr:GTP 3',8-cyclase MoaA [Candidatus Thiodiazotropha lotti]MCG8003701.1 GTP 3',8-cyclase MoaA [Candidatus Thiodiazotropha lotti]MCW4187322.1 GTP 3',8-cyclase MoaA [Candidatus Thiodiazotropha lotti]MCW4200051.1 GTP 3',8-cyclase MoaA [Candidatus Thiodiazotropha lotti]